MGCQAGDLGGFDALPSPGSACSWILSLQDRPRPPPRLRSGSSTRWLCRGRCGRAGICRAPPAIPAWNTPGMGAWEILGLQTAPVGVDPGCCPPGNAGSALLVPESSVCLGEMVWLGLEGSVLSWLSVCLSVPLWFPLPVHAFLGCCPTLLQLKIKTWFFGINCWRCLFFSEHPSSPGKLDQAVGGSVSRGHVGWDNGSTGEVSSSRVMLFPIHRLPWKHKSTKSFCCMACWSLMLCQDGLGSPSIRAGMVWGNL